MTWLFDKSDVKVIYESFPTNISSFLSSPSAYLHPLQQSGVLHTRRPIQWLSSSLGCRLTLCKHHSDCLQAPGIMLPSTYQPVVIGLHPGSRKTQHNRFRPGALSYGYKELRTCVRQNHPVCPANMGLLHSVSLFHWK